MKVTICVIITLRILKHFQSERSDGEAEKCEWLKKCLISSSPNMDIMAMAQVQKFAILEESPKLSKRFEVVASVIVYGPQFDPEKVRIYCAVKIINILSLKNYITSICTFCLASTRSAEASSIDWTCVCIGLSNGYVQVCMGSQMVVIGG